MGILSDFEKAFLERFPEWKECFDSHFKEYDSGEKIGDYIVVGDFLLPLMDRFEDNADDVSIGKLFQLFEDVASWDKYHEELIYIEVAEWLHELGPRRPYFERYAGPIVRHAAATIHQWNVLYGAQ